MDLLSPDLSALAAPGDLPDRLGRFASDESAEPGILPWASLLPPGDRERLRADLRLVLAEPELTDEPLDWGEVLDILREYAAAAGWDGPLAECPPGAAAEARYVVDLHPDDEKTLTAASPAVQRVGSEILAAFLPQHPTAGELLPRGRLKKLANRDVWQIDLPDGYRLRYYLDEPERRVHVVYLGPHPDGEADGRERALRARIQRRRHGGR